jgi:hypothetical protein
MREERGHHELSIEAVILMAVGLIVWILYTVWNEPRRDK